VTRVLTGAILVALSLFVIGLAPAWLFWLLLSLTAVLASTELARVLDGMERPAWPWLATAGVLGTMGSFVAGGPPLSLVLTALLIAVFLRTVVSRSPPNEASSRVASSLLFALYLGLTFGHIGALHGAGGGSFRGQGPLLFAIASVYVGDIAAFYGGRAFGRRRLAPSVSPGKTWEGAACGVIGAVVAAWTCERLSVVDYGASGAAVLGVLVGVAGIAGDLAESMLKRAGRIKDSGALLPGHGGVLDRLDSLLFAAPVVYWADRVLASAL